MGTRVKKPVMMEFPVLLVCLTTGRCGVGTRSGAVLFIFLRCIRGRYAFLHINRSSCDGIKLRCVF